MTKKKTEKKTTRKVSKTPARKSPLKARGAEWIELLRSLVFIRRFEEATEREFRKGKIGGYLHVYTGQEAVVGGILSAVRDGDIVYAGYRDHAHTLMLGSDPGAVMAELFGKRTGISKGKGGSMHLFDAEHGFYGGYGIVGGHLALATGSAYALRYRESDNVVVCFFGDGAMNIGSFHEALNMAGLWGRQGMCPALFVIENNGYAMGTAVERHSALTDLGKRMDAYAIPNEKVDGQDVFAMREAADRAIASIRKTGRPYCIEAMTYRFSGHGAADILQPYRSKEEVEEAKQKDPIRLAAMMLIDAGVITSKDLDAMEEEAKSRVKDAVQFAVESELPDPAELFTDIVSEDWADADTRSDDLVADEEGDDHE
jgi:pyruvate dehydrogenase E1 component alpha subunit